jgi:hypothetical protein
MNLNKIAAAVTATPIPTTAVMLNNYDNSNSSEVHILK